MMDRLKTFIPSVQQERFGSMSYNLTSVFSLNSGTPVLESTVHAN